MQVQTMSITMTMQVCDHWIENYNFAYIHLHIAGWRRIRLPGPVERLPIWCVSVAARGESHSRRHQGIWQPNSYGRTNGPYVSLFTHAQWIYVWMFFDRWLVGASISQCTRVEISCKLWWHWQETCFPSSSKTVCPLFTNELQSINRWWFRRTAKASIGENNN